jgi:tellurite methyltransferase
VADWDHRFSRGEHATSEPSKLLVRVVKNLKPSRALDIACGAGRHAVYLASHGWDVTAVDSSRVGIELLNERARTLRVAVNARIADLEGGEFQIERDAFDLICVFYYLQRDLFPKLYVGLRAGGTFIAAIHMVDESPDIRPMNPDFLLQPGELRKFFRGWTIEHYHETAQHDTDAGDHTRRTAEIIAHKT